MPPKEREAGSRMTKPHRSPELEAAMTAFFQASALLDDIRLKIWDRENLTVTQLRLMAHLREQEGLSNAELAERLYVTRPSVSALLERLERSGYIRREVSPNDRRGINIWLEPKGREISENYRDEIRDYVGRLFESMSAPDVATFTAAVEKFVGSGRARRAKDLAAENYGAPYA
jgi:DNA-binding MarR family transcriptional regulator